MSVGILQFRGEPGLPIQELQRSLFAKLLPYGNDPRNALRIEGSIQRFGGRVRFRAVLVDASDDRVLQAVCTDYDAPPDRWGGIIENFTARIYGQFFG